MTFFLTMVVVFILLPVISVAVATLFDDDQ